MTAFSDWKDRPISQKIYLAEVYIALHLMDWDLTSGKTYTYELDVLEIPQINFLPQFQEVTENGAALTERSSIALVEANPGSYFYDQANAKIYVHTTGSDDPDGTTGGKADYTILAWFYLYFGSYPKIFDNNYYYPRISKGGLSDLSVSSRTIYFGTQTTGNGTLRMQNEDRWFDQLMKRYIWANKKIEIKLGGDELIYSDYATIFKGTILDWDGNDREISFSLKDYRCLLLKKLPQDIFSREIYPNLAASDEGKKIPIAYGYFTSAQCIRIVTTPKTFKIAGHAIYQIITVYNNGTPISSGYITKDLPNGEFTVGAGAGTLGTITADFIGKPLDSQEVVYTDDFSDNDISDWDQYGSGGTWSWVAASGKVTANSQDLYHTHLIHLSKNFSAGEIEAKITPVSGTHNSWTMGITFDWQDIDNWKRLIIMPTIDQIRFQQCVLGVVSSPAQESVTINAGTQYTVKLTVDSAGLAKGYVDGVEEISYDFAAPFTPRPCGLDQGYGLSTDFDDFKVTIPYMILGGQILEDICEEYLDIDSSDIDSTSFTTAKENAGEMLAVYLSSGEEASTIIERIAHANLCRFVIGEDGKVYYLWWDSGDAVADTIETYEILGDYSASEKEEDIYSTCRIKHSIGAGSQWSYSEWNDPQVSYLYNISEAKDFETYLSVTQDAEDLAYRLFNLVRDPVTRTNVKTKIIGLDLKIGDVVLFKRNRGISITGNHNTNFRIVGLRKNFSRMETVLELVSNSAALGEGLCETNCQQPCESACQETCMIHCQTGCEVVCEGNCQINCKTTCQISCMTSCEISQCEIVCKSGCQGPCQGTCQTSCELGCEETCEVSCQTPCESSCQAACLSGCRAPCEMGCQVSE